MASAVAVQELSTAPPEKYILKDGIGGIDFPMLEHLGLLTSSETELEKLKLAFSSSGYIQ
ncbi:hypothetical protein CASFOL_038506 [Castilleja foliolosa]|uniref:Uncharacterized protein n=1 Tax=Castilleja foliolosa TaxID=1961234 RepID=A0ABD3BL81_9LAMI